MENISTLRRGRIWIKNHCFDNQSQFHLGGIFHLTSNNGLYSTKSSTSKLHALVPVLAYEYSMYSHANLCACKWSPVASMTAFSATVIDDSNSNVDENLTSSYRTCFMLPSLYEYSSRRSRTTVNTTMKGVTSYSSYFWDFLESAYISEGARWQTYQNIDLYLACKHKKK